MSEYEAKNSKKAIVDKLKTEPKNVREKTKNKSKHILDTDKSTMPQRYNIKNIIVPYKSKNKSSTSHWKLMQQGVLYTVLRQICFPLSGYWTKLLLHPTLYHKFFSTLFRCGLWGALEKPQKQCLPLVLYFVTLHTLQLFRWVKKRRGRTTVKCIVQPQMTSC